MGREVWKVGESIADEPPKSYADEVRELGNPQLEMRLVEDGQRLRDLGVTQPLDTVFMASHEIGKEHDDVRDARGNALPTAHNVFMTILLMHPQILEDRSLVFNISTAASRLTTVMGEMTRRNVSEEALVERLGAISTSEPK